MTARPWAAALLIGLSLPALAEDGAPLSAIDWLSQSVRAPQAAPGAPRRQARRPAEPPVAGQVQVPSVQVIPLDSPVPQAVGTRLPADIGLSDRIWLGSSAEALGDVIAALPRTPLPAAQDLLRTLLLLRATTPVSLPAPAFTRMRVDHLLEIGALADAKALIEAQGPQTPDLFRRYFDITLLTGDENQACDVMSAAPAGSVAFSARVFCLARRGDWSAAALTLGTARALGELTDLEEDLLSRFLDPDLYEGNAPPPPTGAVTPFAFRLREAVGYPLVTTGRPIAFRVADLRHNLGWKTQIEAAETLCAAGVLAPSQLREIYLAGKASASGGVWERVRAFAALEAALETRDLDAVSRALPPAWAAMEAAQLEPQLAELWGDRLSGLGLTGRAGALADQIALLSPQAADLPLGDSFADHLATGRALPSATTDKERAVAEAFAEDSAPDALAQLIESDRGGEALLRAISLIEAGRAGDPAAVRDGLRSLRVMGLDQAARRIAVQYLILHRPQ